MTKSKDNASTSASTGANGSPLPLQTLLKEADLLEYLDKMKTVLKLRHAGDLNFTKDEDLDSIGMSKPEQRRLRHAFSRHFPQSSFVFKLKKVFGKSDSKNHEYVNASASNGNGSAEGTPQHVIPVDKIQLCKELGQGEFGHVYLSSWTQNTGEVIQVAVKRVLPEKLIANPSSFLTEAAIMTKMRHENVVRLYGVVLDTKSVMLVSELAPCGSLLECVQKPALRNSFPVDVICLFAHQIAKGMQYLASERLIHRDLAARNVLVFSAEKVKISDFGLSRSLGIGEDYYRSEFNPSMKLPIAWCAPECINFLRFTEKSDVWSYAVTLWEAFSYGEMPWMGYTGAQILSAIDQKGLRLSSPRACPAEIFTLMEKCWAHDPDDRPSFDQLVSTLPDVMPQLLISINDVNTGDPSMLKFKRNEVIILLDRNPREMPNSNLWLGAMRTGALGLFKPADTVAYLGAEIPAPATSLVNFRTAPSVKKKDKSAKLPPEMKKLMISEPQGDVRHTCHVGIDGTSFGLLQVDKNELSKALPPAFPDGTNTPPRPAPRRTMTAVTGSQLSPGTPVRHISSEKNVLANGESSPPPVLFPRMRPGINPPGPPALPPKPARSGTALTIENRFSQGSLPTSPSSTLESKRRTVAGDLASEFQQRREKLLSMQLQSEDSNGSAITTLSSQSSHPETMLDQVLSELQQDITNISMTSTRTADSLDFNETRPLLNGNSVHATNNGGVLSYMNDNQFDSLQKSAEEKHRKAEKELEKMRTFERKESKKAMTASFPTVLPENDPKQIGTYAARTVPTSPSTEWTDEAQAAYKLLVQCGNNLKATSPDIVSIRKREASSPSTASSTSTELTIISGTQYMRASAPPIESMSPVSTINRKSPPPAVPPKPKTRVEAHRVDDYANQITITNGGRSKEIVEF